MYYRGVRDLSVHSMNVLGCIADVFEMYSYKTDRST